MLLTRVMISKIVAALLTKHCLALSCLSCEEYECPQLQCPGTTVLGPCKCCYECAKQLNQVCGGPFATSGTCDEGLYCAFLPGADVINDIGFCHHVYDYVCSGITPRPSTSPPEGDTTAGTTSGSNTPPPLSTSPTEGNATSNTTMATTTRFKTSTQTEGGSGSACPGARAGGILLAVVVSSYFIHFI